MQGFLVIEMNQDERIAYTGFFSICNLFPYVLWHSNIPLLMFGMRPRMIVTAMIGGCNSDEESSASRLVIPN